MFIIDSETYNDREYAKTYAARLYYVNCLGDKWDRDLTCKEIEVERENVIVYDKSCDNPIVNMLK